MKIKAAVILGVLSLLVQNGYSQNTAFTYQGRLNENGLPANGIYDLRFTIYDGLTNGISLGVVTNLATEVNEGLFTVQLDFGDTPFDGGNRWLEVGVRPTGETGEFTSLNPRNAITHAPYSIRAATSGSAISVVGAVPANQLAGTILPENIAPGTITSDMLAEGNTFTGTFSGDGSELTSLDASQLVTGTVPDARLSTNVARLNASQTFTGQNTIQTGGTQVPLRITDGDKGNIAFQTLGGAFSGFQSINFNGYFAGSEQRYNTNKNRWRMVVDQRGGDDSFKIDAHNGTSSTDLLTIRTNGNVAITGLLRSGSGTGTTDAPNPSTGLVMRRVNSTTTASNSIVAVTLAGSGLPVHLVRDGSNGGFGIQHPAGFLTITCMGMDHAGNTRNFSTTFNAPSEGYVQIYSNSDNVVHFQCTFGDFSISGRHHTRVTLNRSPGGALWFGDLVSTYNQ